MTPEEKAPEENKALVRRLYTEVFANWDYDKLDELIDAGFVSHPAVPGNAAGPAGVRQFYDWLRAAFPDLRYAVEDMAAEGDKVTVRWTWRGTHQGEYYGVAPTGKQVTAAGIAMYRIANGRCAERWVGFNPLLVLRQLGVTFP